MTPTPGVLLTLAFILSFLPSDRVAWAQTGTMSGRVVDEGGVGVPGANVLLKGSRIGALADDGGRFYILKVPVGTYTVIARTVGFAPSEQAGVRVQANQNTIVEFKLTNVPVRLSRGVEIVGTPKIGASGGQRIATTRGDFQADSVALFGAWRWVQTYGGLANETPPPSGWSRVLYFRRDRTYAFWEQDSAGNYLLCSGTFAIHRLQHEPRASLWVELVGWWWKGDERQLITFLDRNTILTYPGSEDSVSQTIVSDALTSKYIREPNLQVPEGADSPGGARVYAVRPPRLHSGLPGSYYVELTTQLNDLRGSTGPLYEWQDLQYPLSVRESYKYTNNEIPSAVIGDFDGDSSPDVAIYGATENWLESKVLCLLSNRGFLHAVTILTEPTVLDPSAAPDTTVSRWRAPHPALYLSLCPAGGILEDADGKSRTLPTDAILVSRLGGEATPYYYAAGEFRKGRSLLRPLIPER